METEKGLLIKKAKNPEKLLWDLLYVVGNRFVLCAKFPKEKLKIEYSGKHEVLNDNVILFKFDQEEQFFKILKLLDYYSINDFFITINSMFSNVKSKVVKMFSNKKFLQENYLLEFPRTFHITEDELFVDFKLFKEYVYQLKRVAKRYTK